MLAMNNVILTYNTENDFLSSELHLSRICWIKLLGSFSKELLSILYCKYLLIFTLLHVLVFIL